MPVASLIVVVCAAAQVSAKSESSAGSCGSHRRRRHLRIGQHECSPAQTESKPAASAAGPPRPGHRAGSSNPC